MSEELAIAHTAHIAAVNSAQLSGAKQHMVEWFTAKVAEIVEELIGVEAAAKYAKDHKWSHSALDSQASRIRQRKMFYEKVLAAIEAGYAIIPNIPLDLFAIRVKRDDVKAPLVTRNYDWQARQSVAVEAPDNLAIGDGRYENPRQRIYSESETKKLSDGKEHTSYNAWPLEFCPMEFPIIAAHPLVMSATQEAMAKRIFDQIGVSPERRRRGDPLVIGQIRMKQGWSERLVSFIIGWNIDLRKI